MGKRGTNWFTADRETLKRTFLAKNIFLRFDLQMSDFWKKELVLLLYKNTYTLT